MENIMKKKFFRDWGFVLSVLWLLSGLPLVAFAAVPETAGAGNAAAGGGTVGESVVNNSYFTESIRYNNLSRLAFADGDYDASFNFSMESIRIARLSDSYITLRLKIAEANKKISEANKRLVWASRSKAETYFPKEYGSARNFYSAALKAKDGGQWDAALNNAMNTIEALANVVAPPPETSRGKAAENASSSYKNYVKNEDGKTPLPAQYTVRPWDTFGDCFWNIAGRSWVYNDPYRWPVLYKANKHKLEKPDNPNLIEPGTILDIPSIRGEVRQGMWDSGKKYSPLDETKR